MGNAISSTQDLNSVDRAHFHHDIFYTMPTFTNCLYVCYCACVNEEILMSAIFSKKIFIYFFI